MTESATGSIYDLGYRRYEGPRLGRAHAVRSLFIHTLRSAYGIGRGGRAKIAPIVLGAMALLPAIAMVGMLTIVAQFGLGERFTDNAPIRYDTYSSAIATIVVLFCAAQAPDLFSRDERHGVLSLYFARALRRADYALARIGGFVVAVLILELLPQLVLFLGRVLLSKDIPAAVGADLPSLGPAVAQGALSSLLVGGLSMAAAAFTPRRAYATAGIIAIFTIPTVVVGVASSLASSGLTGWLMLLSPNSVLDATNAILFGVPYPHQAPFAEMPEAAYFAAVAVGIVGSVAIAVRRFMRIAA